MTEFIFNDSRAESSASIHCEIFKRELERDLERLTISRERSASSRKISPERLPYSMDRPYNPLGDAEERDVWQPVSPINSSKSLTSAIDASPSRSYCKNRFLMGMFDVPDVAPPHAFEQGRWVVVPSRGSFFSVPPRTDWRSQWSIFDRLKVTPHRARSQRVLTAKPRSVSINT